MFPQPKSDNNDQLTHISATSGNNVGISIQSAGLRSQPAAKTKNKAVKLMGRSAEVSFFFAFMLQVVTF